jgi:hypothetical protein
MSTRDVSYGKGGRCPLHPRSLNLLQSQGPVQACIGYLQKYGINIDIYLYKNELAIIILIIHILMACR